MKILFDRILKALGLMRVKRAETVFRGLVTIYENQVLEWVREDFGKLPLPDHDEKLQEWAGTAWRQALSSEHDRDWYILEND